MIYALGYQELKGHLAFVRRPFVGRGCRPSGCVAECCGVPLSVRQIGGALAVASRQGFAGGVMEMKIVGRWSAAALLVAGVLALAACSETTTTGSSGSGFGPSGTTGPGGSVTGGPARVVPPPPVAGVPTMVITLANATTGATTTVVPAIARAIVRDAAGLPVPSIVVTFSTDPTLATLVPASGTALTDATGTATITVNGGSASGAATLTASSQNPANNAFLGFSVGAQTVVVGTPGF